VEECIKERRINHSGHPPLARKSVAPCTYRVGVPRDGLAGPRALVTSRAAARTLYNRQASLARLCLPDSLPAWLYLRRGAVNATVTIFTTRQIRPAFRTYPTRVTKVRYKIEVAGFNNPWAASMRPYMQRLLGTYNLGAKTLELLTAAWAKSTSDTYIIYCAYTGTAYPAGRKYRYGIPGGQRIRARFIVWTYSSHHFANYLLLISPTCQYVSVPLYSENTIRTAIAIPLVASLVYAALFSCKKNRFFTRKICGGHQAKTIKEEKTKARETGRLFRIRKFLNIQCTFCYRMIRYVPLLFYYSTKLFTAIQELSRLTININRHNNCSDD
jgi:hypothetical protein